jgi:hypothetical protein
MYYKKAAKTFFIVTGSISRTNAKKERMKERQKERKKERKKDSQK